MGRSLLAAEELEGLMLVQNKADLSSAFLTPYLLQLALSADMRVVLLMIQDSLLHYQSVLRKMGTNLVSIIESRKVVPIHATSSFTLPEFFQGLTQQIAEACEPPQQDASSGVCVLIDSASALTGLSQDKHELQAFFHYCQVPPATLQGRYACVMSLHSDIQDDMHWLSWLRHQAQTEIEVVALESGASQDITGQVVVTRRQALSPHLPGHGVSSSHLVPLQEGQLLNFRVGPNDVRFS